MMGGDENGAARLSMTDPLPHLSTADLETLLAALDPRLEGFGEGENCLDDASAFLARLDLKDGRGGDTPIQPMVEWIERWRATGGSRDTLRLMVSTVLAQMQDRHQVP